MQHKRCFFAFVKYVKFRCAVRVSRLRLSHFIDIFCFFFHASSFFTQSFALTAIVCTSCGPSCVCVQVCMESVCTACHGCARVYTCIFACTFIRIHAYVYIYIIHACTHVHKPARICFCMHVVCVRVGGCACVCVRVYVCVVHTCIPYVHETHSCI